MCMHARNIPLRPINEQRIGFPCFGQLEGSIFCRVYKAKLKKKKIDTDLPLCKIDEMSCVQICSPPKTTGG